MKKTFTFFIFLIILSSCTPSSKVSKSGFDEIDYVSGFLSLMVNGTDHSTLKTYISPAYIKENNINKADYNVNTYSPVDFRIENYISGMVFTKIWGKDRGWVHKLTFLVVKEDGKLYLKPGNRSESYIDPWYRVETYIVE